MTYPLQDEAHRYRELKKRLLESLPDLEDDPECLLDTLEGLSNIKEQLAGLIRSALLDEANAQGIEQYSKKLIDRKGLLAARAKKKRTIALHYMCDLGLKKIDAPDFAATRRNTPAGVSIYNEDQLPEEFIRTKTEPDKAAIRAALKEGQDIPGAQLGNASETLMVKI